MLIFSKSIKYEIALVVTFKVPVATCGDWRQGWTTLVYDKVLNIKKTAFD